MHFGGNHRREKDFGGQPFSIYKFRTMEQRPAERERWATPEDPG